MLLHGPVSDIIKIKFKYNEKGWYIGEEPPSLNKDFFKDFKKEDTIILIFNRDQKEKLDLLEKEKKEWILYKSPECKNSVHPYTSRNVLVILEKPNGISQ